MHLVLYLYLFKKKTKDHLIQIQSSVIMQIWENFHFNPQSFRAKPIKDKGRRGWGRPGFLRAQQDATK